VFALAASNCRVVQSGHGQSDDGLPPSQAMRGELARLKESGRRGVRDDSLAP